MKSASPHMSDDELLLLADDEASSRKSASLRKHLSVCPGCAERFNRMRSRLVEVSAAYREQRPESWDAPGPRALLQARLAEETKRREYTGTRLLPAILSGRNLAFACALLLLIAISLQALHRQQWRGDLGESGQLPNPIYTPGSTRQANLTDLCATDTEEVVRDVPRPIEQKVYKEYGIKRIATSDFEMDYLITPGLGGTDDLKNLWPEPHANTLWNSYVKDQLEDRLHRMVCERKIPLEQAQREIATDWISAYKKYFQTNQPLASAIPKNTPQMASLR